MFTSLRELMVHVKADHVATEDMVVIPNRLQLGHAPTP